ncbi:MAG: methyl-accepting chemotaxis protein [Pseudomonadota bacterium]
MADWTLTRRMNFIAICLIGALALTGIVSVLSILRIDAMFDNYQASGAQVEIAAEIEQDAFEADRARGVYFLEPTPDHAREVRENLENIRVAEDRLDENFGAYPELLEISDRVQTSLEDYDQSFGEIETLFAERRGIETNLMELIPRIRGMARELQNLIVFDGNQRAVRALDNFYVEILTLRVYAERYVLTADDADFANSREALANATRAIDAAIVALNGSDRTAAARDIASSLAAYETALNEIFANVEGIEALQRRMDAEGAAILADINQISLQIDGIQGATDVAAERTIFVILITLAVIVTASIAGSTVLARRMARQVVGEIENSISEMQQLAEGALDIDITGTERETELGQIARALEVFRDTARETKRLEEASRAEEHMRAELEKEQARQAAQAEVDRQAKVEEARQRMISDLGASVGAAVGAGAQGDFSQRVTTAFDEPELQALAQSINGMLDNVESGVAAVGRVMARMATGDLTERMQGAFRGAFDDLQGNINDSLDNLGRLITDISGQCDGVSTEAGAMTKQSQELARRAEQQAASLEETSAAMEEISASAKSSADGATDAASFANQASEQVDEAGKVVSSAVDAMADIRDASNRIGEIVSVIDGIAFQTNLLALNASVEAARAGSAGKGFAVVATEVRALAQRSSEASQDIKTLIEESSTQVRRGVDLVEETGRTLDEIMGGVRKMAGTMQELTTTAREQATGVGEVTSAITQLDVITQKNAALSEQSRENASRLMQQAEHMRDLLRTFQTAPGGAANAAFAAE